VKKSKKDNSVNIFDNNNKPKLLTIC